ncbi:MAG: NAD(P)H-hydrate dehydratase [Candidatus Verstraetearchaeota archaeon]|nr:NAD(P)H-hydrate dehydratase [Candidatus Verstraetearchaeota archaeon]
MEPILPEDMRALDENAEFLGVSRLQLMENAGKGVVDCTLRRMNLRGKKTLILAYTGNKGGDGFVVARHLASMGVPVSVVLLAKPEQISTGEAMANFCILEKLRSSVALSIAPMPSDVVLLEEAIKSADVLVDAMIGTGAKGELREPLSTAVSLSNSAKSFKVAIDVPTGIDPASGEVRGAAFKADLTVTHHRPKTGLLKPKAKRFVGDLEVVNIGIPPEAEIYAGPGDLRLAVKPRGRFTHKGENGRLLIIGGSSRYVGAPSLAALAALRVGIDLAVVAVPSSIAPTVRRYSPSLIAVPLPSEGILDRRCIQAIKEEIASADAVVMGMGLGLDQETRVAVKEITECLRSSGIPAVIDADALKALGEYHGALRSANAVVTPHSGEFSALTGEKLPKETEGGWRDRLGAVMRWASKLNVTFLLKGRYDIITDGARYKIKTIGNPGLTAGGTGDVLAGIVGGFMSRGVSPYRSAVAASFLNSHAGDILAESMGYHYTARDLVDAIPLALKEFDL